MDKHRRGWLLVVVLWTFAVAAPAQKQRGPERLTIPSNGPVRAFTPFTVKLSALDSFFTGAFPQLGTRHNLTNLVNWSSSDQTIATVSSTGVVSAVGSSCVPGCPVTITASYGRFVASIPVTVYSPASITIANASKQVMNPLPKGEFQQFKATANYNDPSSTMLTLTTQALWKSDNPSAIAIDGFAFISHGLAQAAGTSGTANISCTFNALTSNSIPLTAAPAVLVSVFVAPRVPNPVVGGSILFKATGTYSDGTTPFLPNGSDTVTWASSDTTIATINAATGLAKGIKGGITLITATPNSVGTCPGTNCVAHINVGLQSLNAITPASPVSVTKGLFQQLGVTAMFSDLVTRDVTNSVNWNSTAPTNVSVSATGNTHAVGLSGTNATISGFIGPITCPGLLCAQAVVNVTNATVQSIAVTPAAPTVPLGATQQFTATATYTDGSTKNSTNNDIWSSSAPTVASISNTTSAKYAGAAVGTNWTTPTNATGIFDGSYAVYNNTLQDFLRLTSYGLNVPPGVTIVGFTVIVIGHGASATLADREIDVGLTTDGVSPAGTLKTAQVLNQGSDTRVILGGPADLWGNASLSVAQVTAPTFGVVIRDSDTTAAGLDIDAALAQVYWTQNNASNGLATALKQPGTANIIATGPLGTVASPPVTLTTVPATLVSISVTPKKPTVPFGSSQQFTAKGAFTDGTVCTLAPNNNCNNNHVAAPVTWASTDINVAGVNATGLATPITTSGTSTISATSGSIVGSTVLTAAAAALASISVAPASDSIAASDTLQYAATGSFTDGSQQDITENVTWSSSQLGTATISNANGSEGLATGVAVGPTTNITANDPVSNKTSNTATLNVTARALTSITVAPGTATIDAGTTQQFTATGNYNAAPPMQDITNSVTWGSSDLSVVTISSTGLAAGTGQGSANIQATLGAITSVPVAVLTVNAPNLLSIVVAPANANVPLDNEQQYTATGNYSDGSMLDLTNLTTWMLSDPNLGMIDATGLLTAGSTPGAGTVTATCTASGACPGATSTVVGNTGVTVIF